MPQYFETIRTCSLSLQLPYSPPTLFHSPTADFTSFPFLKDGRQHPSSYPARLLPLSEHQRRRRQRIKQHPRWSRHPCNPSQQRRTSYWLNHEHRRCEYLESLPHILRRLQDNTDLSQPDTGKPAVAAAVGAPDFMKVKPATTSAWNPLAGRLT